MTAKEALRTVLQIKRYYHSKIPQHTTIRIFADEREAETTLVLAINRLEELEKVLKIIKKKQEDKSIAGFLLFDDLHNRVLDRQGYHYIQLSKDDFEILKEYLE